MIITDDNIKIIICDILKAINSDIEDEIANKFKIYESEDGFRVGDIIHNIFNLIIKAVPTYYRCILFILSFVIDAKNNV